MLLIHNGDLDASAITALHAHVHSRLTASCRDHGLRQPDQLHAVRIDSNVSAIAAGGYADRARRVHGAQIAAHRTRPLRLP